MCPQQAMNEAGAVAVARNRAVVLALGALALPLPCCAGGSDDDVLPPSPLQKPALMDVAERSATILGAAVSIDFANSGGDAQACVVAGGQGLPGGLGVAVADVNGKRTCRVSGQVAFGAAPGRVSLVVTATNAAGSGNGALALTIVEAPPGAVVDADADGLIEISSLAMLDNVRHSLDGSRYRTAAGEAGVAGGCPQGRCRGYELMANLDFDRDGDGSVWTVGRESAVSLDDDDKAEYFDTTAGGWVPIGDCGMEGAGKFAAVFEGNGHTIANFVSISGRHSIGLFGCVEGAGGQSAEIRNLSVSDSIALYTGDVSNNSVGILVGMNDGRIVNCRSSGLVVGGNGKNNFTGGLVGSHRSQHIVASSSSAAVLGAGETNDSVGGLVGLLRGSGAIIASFATGSVDGGVGRIDTAGGLVGRMESGAITASYATGAVSGGDGDGDDAGGLVGVHNGGPITASYATGAATGGGGDFDNAGALLGRGNSSMVFDSYGFTPPDGETVESRGASLPNGVSEPSGLSQSNAGDPWAANAAWDFGTASQAPALNYADYDGASAIYHCISAATAAAAPSGAILIPHCGTDPPLLPGQR